MISPYLLLLGPLLIVIYHVAWSIDDDRQEPQRPGDAPQLARNLIRATVWGLVGVAACVLAGLWLLGGGR